MRNLMVFIAYRLAGSKISYKEFKEMNKGIHRMLLSGKSDDEIREYIREKLGVK